MLGNTGKIAEERKGVNLNLENLKQLIIQLVNRITDYERLRKIYTVIKNL